MDLLTYLLTSIEKFRLSLGHPRSVVIAVAELMFSLAYYVALVPRRGAPPRESGSREFLEPLDFLQLRH